MATPIYIVVNNSQIVSWIRPCLEPNAKIGTVTSITDIATKAVNNGNNPAIVEDLDFSSADLTSDQQVVLQEFLNKYSDVFAKSDSDLGRTDILEHSIDTQGHQPIYQRPYRIPEAQRKVVDAHVKVALNQIFVTFMKKIEIRNYFLSCV